MKSIILLYITNVLLGIIYTIVGVYAMVTVYGWAVFAWMMGLGLIAQALLWYSFYRAGKNTEAESLSAAVARARQQED